jgi:hypothetical protein
MDLRSRTHTILTLLKMPYGTTSDLTTATETSCQLALFLHGVEVATQLIQQDFNIATLIRLCIRTSFQALENK